MPLPFDLDAIEFRALDEDCDRPKFSCGHELVDLWFHEKAITAHGRNCRVWTAHVAGENGPVAFYALGYAVSLLNHKIIPFWTTSRFPSLRLEWLGVRKDLQGNLLGEFIMGRVIDVFLDQIKAAHLPAMTLIPASERAANFYRKLGFQPLTRTTKEFVLSATDVLAMQIEP